MPSNRIEGLIARMIGRGGIIIFFLLALEFMIMISPFAFFFYSIFNPLFLFLDHYEAFKWLTGFFLPHMILPPTLFLKTVRILGSLLFLAGASTFLICALQVYAGKILKWGVATAGLYKYIRHPQYLGLGAWGAGMSILWPRFIVLVFLSLMFMIYYFLAKDEERRMLKQYRDSYENYMQRTGMFFPKLPGRRLSLQRIFARYPVMKYFAVPMIVTALVMGAGFLFRRITIDSIPIESGNNISLVSMLPEDNELRLPVLGSILGAQQAGNLKYLDDDKEYLGYLMPVDYMMQGMIADTDSEFHLYKQHHTIAMITDWVLHPFRHLRTSPSLHMAKMHHVDPSIARRHHCPLGINDPELACEHCPYRRVIIVEVDDDHGRPIRGRQLLSFNTTRIPVYSIDINTRTGDIVNAKRVEKATAWEDVPTPVI